MRGFNNKRGFTVIELMTAMCIFAVLIVAIYSILLIGDSTTRTGLTYIELSQDSRLGIDRMIRELRSARRSTINIPDGSYITFQVPGSDTLQYSLAGIGGRQLIRTEGETTTVLCNNVQDIQFSPSPFSGSTIFITLETQKTSLSGRNLTRTSDISVKVRN